MAIYTIDEICYISKGKTGIKYARKGHYPLVTTAEEYLSCENFDFEANAVCIPLVSSTGHGHASINRIHYLEGKFALGSILAAVIPKDEKILISKYLYVYLFIFKDALIVPLMQGSANVSLTLNAIKGIKVEVPNLLVQQTIISLFEKSQSYYTFLKEKFHYQENLIISFKDSILHEAYNGGLSSNYLSKNSEIFDSHNPLVKSTLFSPPNIEQSAWPTLSLDEVCIIKMGQSPPGESYNDQGKGVPLINGPVEFSAGDFGLTKKSKFTTSPTQMTSKGDLLLCVRGSTTGRTNIADFDACIGRGVASISPLIHKEYVYYFMTYLKNDILNMGTGLKFPSVSRSQISNLRIPVPPIDTQEFIVRRIKELLNNVEKLSSLYYSTKTAAEELFKTIFLENFNKYLNDTFYEISTIFTFVDKPKRYMKQQPVVSSKNKIELTLQSIFDIYSSEQFTFNDFKNNIDGNYENVKEFIFKMLEEGKAKKKPYLSLSFSDSTAELYFKIIS
jgi:type I restriction enzyme S subunit